MTVISLDIWTFGANVITAEEKLVITILTFVDQANSEFRIEIHPDRVGRYTV